ncbi:hypothetical protein EWB00_005444 [Schistosoma japonicum]|uniref:Trematode PH-like domain-containing protein n=1 Tax=Schistosoma japonicum TaxID=6182 RepID=A0A4Z2DUG7_SCHJA|nr:hypothetical protein KSF78_0003659 [Schistosoma japonicum]KAH8867293.1 hypothetical protein KSF78_0003659 [Schistosoma japonicum]TNN20079.1 hypothetical protein EWB00_005444 [Schistosoma japonicum]
MKSKRSTSKIRNSEPIDDILRHVGTKQYLFLETHICTIYRVTCSPGESFSESKALSLVEKYHRKRQSHCNAGLLEDRFSLERTKTTGKIPFRPWVSYKEIMHMYVSHTRPEYFVLCIDSQRSLQKYYEIYKCKSAANTRKVEELMRRAMNDPDKKLHDVSALRQVAVKDSDRVRSLPNFEEENIRDTMVEDTSPSPPYHYPSPPPVCQLPSPVMVSPVKQVPVYNALSPSPGPLNFERYNVDDLENVTYIKLDPNKGPMIDKEGPIYMFFSRQKNNLTEPSTLNNYVNHNTPAWNSINRNTNAVYSP